MLEVRAVNAAYDEKLILKNFSYSFEKGKFYGILGPNGSGKSTLLKVMSGVLKTQTGDVLLECENIHQLPSKQLAKEMAILTQFHQTAFTNTVRETVSAGRYPYQSGFFSSWTAEDEQAVVQAMQQTGVEKYEHTPMDFLSGGEQQRVFIAQALAQRAKLLLLDEPTNHLDISYQKQTLDLMYERVKRETLTVIGIFHDINLAALYCDELILMEDGEIVAAGAPHEVVKKAEIEQVYKANVSVYAHPQQAKPQVTLVPEVAKPHQRLTADDVKFFEDHLVVAVTQPLKTVSSAVYNAGVGWYTTFINRTVAPTYNTENVEVEVEQFLGNKRYTPTTSVAMLTAVPMKCAVVESYEHEGASIVVIVTAGTQHAIDVSKAISRNRHHDIGTINTFVFINGDLAEEAFYQAMMTATEAKVKALFDENIKDTHTQTFATGTGTDSLLIAATQVGEQQRYAGPLTKIGQLIGYGVYDATKKAIMKYNNHVNKGV